MSYAARRPEAAFLFGMFDLQHGLAIDHQYDRQPAVPRPGQPIVLRVATAPDLADVTVIAAAGVTPSDPVSIEAAGTEYPGRRVASHWEVILPGMPDGTVLSYLVRTRDRSGRSWYADGKRPERAATVFTHRVTSRRPPTWTRRAVVYQVFVDRFATAEGTVQAPAHPKAWAGGDLAGVTAAIPYLADLGISAIWLTPVFACTSYHGYDTEDFRHVDRRFGGDSALRTLVAEAEKADIRILLDLVPNHVSNRHPWFAEAQEGGSTRSWFTFHDDGTYETFFGNPGMPRLNVDEPAARAAIIDVARFWIDEFGIAGYRIDHVLGPSESFLAELAAEVNSAHPDAWLFGEATATAAFCRRYGGLLDGVTDFGFAYAMRDFFAGRLTLAGLVELEQEPAAAIPHSDFSWLRFFDNHDMGRASFEWGDDPTRVAQAAELLARLPGVPALFYGTEQGLTHGISAAEGGLEVGRVPMRYGDTEGLVAPIRELLLERRRVPDPAEPVLWTVTPAGASHVWGELRGFVTAPGAAAQPEPTGDDPPITSSGQKG
jgi:hypothetical protein